MKELPPTVMEAEALALELLHPSTLSPVAREAAERALSDDASPGNVIGNGSGNGPAQSCGNCSANNYGDAFIDDLGNGFGAISGNDPANGSTNGSSNGSATASEHGFASDVVSDSGTCPGNGFDTNFGDGFANSSEIGSGNDFANDSGNSSRHGPESGGGTGTGIGIIGAGTLAKPRLRGRIKSAGCDGGILPAVTMSGDSNEEELFHFEKAWLERVVGLRGVGRGDASVLLPPPVPPR